MHTSQNKRRGRIVGEAAVMVFAGAAIDVGQSDDGIRVLKEERRP